MPKYKVTAVLVVDVESRKEAMAGVFDYLASGDVEGIESVTVNVEDIEEGQED